MDQLCLSNVTFTISLEKQLSACGRNVRGIVSGGEHLILSARETPVGPKDTEAGRGRSCPRRETGTLLATVALLPASNDGEMSPGAPEPPATGAWQGHGLRLLLLHRPTAPTGEGRNALFCSAAVRRSQVMMQEPRVINKAAI